MILYDNTGRGMRPRGRGHRVRVEPRVDRETGEELNSSNQGPG